MSDQRSESARFDAFVSHNSKDKPWVRQLVSDLRFFGLSVFFDEDSIPPGANIVEELGAALDASNTILMIITPASLASKWVAMEVATGIYSDPASERRRLVPVFLENVDRGSVPSPIRGINSISFVDADRREVEYQRLLAHLGVAEIARLGPHHFPEAAPKRSLPADNVYVTQRTRDLVLDLFPQDIADLSAFWIRHDMTFKDLVDKVGTLHPTARKTFSAALGDALGKVYDAKYALMDGSNDARAMDPGAWQAEYYQILTWLGMDLSTRPAMLSVGLGNGHEWADFYAGFSKILGVDLSNESLSAAKRRHPTLHILRADAAKLNGVPSSTFDIYTSLRTYQSTLFDVKRAALEATRILKPGGIFLVSMSDAHRVPGGVVRGIVEPDSREVNFDRPYQLAERTRRQLSAIGYGNIGIRTGLYEVYVYGARP